MTEGRQCMITFEQIARLFGFGQNDANRHKIYYTLHFDASKIRFMFPKKEGVWERLWIYFPSMHI
jgi:hypothetical protein